MFTTGLKKTTPTQLNEQTFYELDELYWFVERKSKSKTRENVYLITMVSRNPRQIVGFDVARDKSPGRIQAIVDSAPGAKYYCTDGDLTYINVIYPGRHVRNVANKKDTYTVESINADLRHYIPILARRSRCFARKIDTLYAVMAVFVEAYNRFAEAKSKFRHGRNYKSRELPFSVLDFI